MRFIAFLLLFYVYAFCGVVLDNTDKISDFKISYYQDLSKKQTIEDVQKIHFQKTVNSRFTLGYPQGTVWFKIDITNHTKQKNFLLYFTTDYCEYFTYFEKVNGKWEKNPQGSYVQRVKRFISDKNPSHMFSITPGKSKSIYVKVDTDLSVIGEFIIYGSSNAKVKDRGFVYLAYAFYFGGLVVAIALNLFLFFTFKESIYIFYVGYLVSFGGVLTTLATLNIDLGYGNLEQVLGSAPSFALFFLLQFFRKLVHIKRKYKKVDYLLITLSWIFMFLGVMITMNNDPWYEIMNMLSLPALFVLLIGVFLITLTSGWKIKLYFAVLLIHIIALTLMSLVYLDFVDNTLFNFNAFKVFSFVEMIFFSLLLANRAKEENIQKMKVQNILLEKEVSYYKQMRKTMQLTEENKELEKVSITDKLTQKLNRRGIDNWVEEKFQQYQQTSQKFGMILVDIDYFKKVNDTFGHQVGDKFLIEVAKILQLHTRNTDVVGRWGGEEFLIICENMTLESLYKVAENLRIIIEKFDFGIIGGRTASFGIGLVKEDDTKDTLLKRVDDSLYISKRNGRNKVSYID
jgi:diguanylate cyclase (GGDEF)-like protein